MKEEKAEAFVNTHHMNRQKERKSVSVSRLKIDDTQSFQAYFSQVNLFQSY